MNDGLGTFEQGSCCEAGIAHNRPMREPWLVVKYGAVLGAAFGAWNLVQTWIDPLADDSSSALLRFYSPMFTAWGIAGFATAKRTGRIADAIRVGAMLALATFVVFWIANLIRVNVFLEAVSHRADWQSLVRRFRESGFENFRAYINYEYLTGAPLKFFVPTVIGAITGLVGGISAIAVRSQRRGIPLS